MNEGGFFLPRFPKCIETDRNNRPMFECETDVSISAWIEFQHCVRIEILCHPNWERNSIVLGETESRSIKDIFEPFIWGRWFRPSADKASFPSEDVHASLGMIFPRQHAQCEVGMVLQASKVALLTVSTSDERRTSEGARTEFPNHGKIFIVSGVQ